MLPQTCLAQRTPKGRWSAAGPDISVDGRTPIASRLLISVMKHPAPSVVVPAKSLAASFSRRGAKPSQRLHKASSTLEDTTAKDVFVVVEVLRLEKQKLHGQAIHSVMPVSGVIAQGVQRISEHTVPLIPSIDCTLKAPYCDLNSLCEWTCLLLFR